MNTENKMSGFAVSMMTVFVVAFAAAGWYTKANYAGTDLPQLLFRFFIFLMGAVAVLAIPWMGLYFLVNTIIEKGKMWAYWTMCFAVMILAYLVTT